MTTRGKVHFIGIGGIGMSALAQYYQAKGWQVSGSDVAESDITAFLKRTGVEIMIGHRALNLLDEVDRIIFSAAVTDDNPELEQAKLLKVETISYAEALGELTRQYITIAVSGAHGKSTTTALISLIMIKAGLDPTVIIGTRLHELHGTNFRLGQSRYLVIEADEYNRSFWHYYPTIAVVTNIDKEHLDTYGDLAGVINGFVRYFKNIAAVGALIYNNVDPNIKKALKHWQTVQKQLAPKLIKFTTPKTLWPLQIPGMFNQSNAEAAWRAVQILGVSRRMALEALKTYQGSWRRLEPLMPRRQATAANKQKFFTDYAHHPTEIQATIGALKQSFPKRKLVIIFQPHQVQRLNNLFEDFVKAFDECDRLILLPTYQVAGRETTTQKTTYDLFSEIKKWDKVPEYFYLKNLSRAVKLIKQFPSAVVVFMGAGDIDAQARRYFKSKLF